MLDFDEIRDRYKIRKLRKEINRIREEVFREGKTAEDADKPIEEIRAIYERLPAETNEMEWDLERLESRLLVMKAQKLKLPILDPRDEKTAELEHQDGYLRGLLNPKGKYIISKMIRDEQKERREAWMPFVSLMIGLGGVIVAILALIID